jgi:hypothetical protein
VPVAAEKRLLFHDVLKQIGQNPGVGTNVVEIVKRDFGILGRALLVAGDWQNHLSERR